MKALQWLCALMLALLLLLGTFFLLVQSEGFYRFLIQQSGAYAALDLPKESVDEAAGIIARYMAGKSEHLIVQYEGQSLFKAQEIFHMYEVRQIFQHINRGFLILGAVFFVLMVLLKHQRFKVLNLQLYAMGILFAVFFVAALNFDKAFLWMHQVLFKNLFWAFREDHYLIRFLNEKFFLWFMVITAGGAWLLSIATYVLNRITSREITKAPERPSI